ncbi:MAG: hypothetical protein ACT6S0_14355 [Roseateles sp.]|uniref:hypothetical protein n=1 Tax=Roseateles sp. TaxID=1971397 RepID=UPI0040357946
MQLGIDRGTSTGVTAAAPRLPSAFSSNDNAVNAPLCLPYLAGERTPHISPNPNAMPAWRAFVTWTRACAALRPFQL